MQLFVKRPLRPVRRAGVGEVAAVRLRLAPEPADGAVDAEERGIVEVVLAREVDAGLAVARHAARCGILLVLRLVRGLARGVGVGLGIGVDVHRERDLGVRDARPLRTNAGARHAHAHGERPPSSRHVEPAPHAPPAVRGEADAVVRVARRALGVDLLQLRVLGHRLVQLTYGILPERIEVRRVLRAGTDFLGFVGYAPVERALPSRLRQRERLFVRTNGEAHETRRVLRGRDRERIALREIHLALGKDLLAEVV